MMNLIMAQTHVALLLRRSRGAEGRPGAVVAVTGRELEAIRVVAAELLGSKRDVQNG